MPSYCNLKEFLTYLDNIDALRFLYFIKRLSTPAISISLENVRIMLQIASKKYGWDTRYKIDFDEDVNDLVNLFCVMDRGFCCIDYPGFQEIFDQFPDIVIPIKEEHLDKDELDITYVSISYSHLQFSDEPISDNEDTDRDYKKHLKALYNDDYAIIDEEIATRQQTVHCVQKRKKSKKLPTEDKETSRTEREIFRQSLQNVIKSTIEKLPNDLANDSSIFTKEIPLEDVLFLVIDRNYQKIGEKEYDEMLKNWIGTIKNPSIPSSAHTYHSLSEILGKPALHKVLRRVIWETWTLYSKSNISVTDGDEYIDYHGGFDTPSDKYNLKYALRLIVHNKSSFVVHAYVDANTEGRAVLEDKGMPIILTDKKIDPQKVQINCNEKTAKNNFKEVVGDYGIQAKKYYQRNTEVYARIIAYNIKKLTH